MEAVTDVVFRHVVKKAGAPDVFFTEFTNATGWVHAGDKAIGGRLVKTHDEAPIVAQLWGSVPEDMAKLAAHCKQLGYHGIDINMGCPDASAVKAGGGAAMIRTPELATAMIAATKTASLLVSVKTRLGYSKPDEWKEWLAHLLHQDIVNLTIHLRTKKEMSKVAAHHELIPDIITLRNEIAPATLLTINGDIENRSEGLALVEKYPGIDGVMIGRGIFHDPFCFTSLLNPVLSPLPSLSGGVTRPTSLEHESGEDGAAQRSDPRSKEAPNKEPAREIISENLLASDSLNSAPAAQLSEPFLQETKSEEQPDTLLPGAKSVPARNGLLGKTVTEDERSKLMALLNFHLDLHDEWDTPEHPRKFDPLKRFFKVYVHSFEGAAELRDKLMHTKNTAEVRAVLKEHFLY